MEFTTHISPDNKIVFDNEQLQKLADKSRAWNISYDDLDDSPGIQSLDLSFDIHKNHDVVNIVVSKEYGNFGKDGTHEMSERTTVFISSKSIFKYTTIEDAIDYINN